MLAGGFAAGIGPAIGQAFAAPMSEAVAPPAPSGPLSFAQCVGIALKESPFLASSSLEIDVRRLDESDSRYGFVPSVSLRTRYFVNSPNDSQPYSIQFVTEPFNPVESYFTLQARKVITQMAVLGHLRAISDFVHRLALGFLELDALGQVETYQDELISLARRNSTFTTERLRTGGSSPLEVRVAVQEADLAVMERERLASSRSTIEEGLKNLLGPPDSRDVSLNTTNAGWQVLGSFDPALVNFSQVQSDSIELKIQNMKQELQTRYVSLAKARFLPTLLFGLETADPLSRSQDGELFFSVGLELPLWDGLKRLHDITRQKTILHQYNAEEAMKDIDLAAKWRAALDKLKNASADLELARAREELAGLKKQQSEISYHSGSAYFGAFLAESKGLVEARKNVVLKSLERDKAILGLRHLSGDLHKAYVDTSSF
jgi:outer membrane protein TolC